MRSDVEGVLTRVLGLLMDAKPHAWWAATWLRAFAEGVTRAPAEVAARHAEKADQLCALAIRQVRDLLEWGPSDPPAQGQLVLLVPEPQHLTAPAWRKAA